MLLEVRSVTKKFGGLIAISNFSFVLEKGIMTSLIGPNGAGKTTLFNIINGIYPPTSGSIIFEMDADLSHNPKYIPDFLDAINSGYDLVLGSRRVKGGGVKGWGKYRKLVSFIGSLIPKVILGIRVKDLTTGYRAYTKNALKKIKIEEVESEGYFFQIETLYRAEKAGLKIKEIPIIFVDRKKGKSKLSKLEFLKYLSGTIKLKLKKF